MKTAQSASITSLASFKNPAKTADQAEATQGNSSPAHPDRFLKIKAVLDRVGMGRSTVYAYIETGRFPTQIKIGRASYWSEIEITAWMDALKAQAGKHS